MTPTQRGRECESTNVKGGQCMTDRPTEFDPVGHVFDMLPASWLCMCLYLFPCIPLRIEHLSPSLPSCLWVHALPCLCKVSSKIDKKVPGSLLGATEEEGHDESMGEANLCSINKTVPETLDDRQQIMVLGCQDELSSGVLDGVHCCLFLMLLMEG